jgi:hypothetical protein
MGLLKRILWILAQAVAILLMVAVLVGIIFLEMGGQHGIL